MNSRDKILSRLKSVSPAGIQLPPHQADREIYLDHPGESASLLESFQHQLLLLHGEVHLATNPEQASGLLYNIVKEFPTKSCLLQNSAFIDDVIKGKKELEVFIDKTFPLEEDSVSYSKFTAGITTADYLVARTGSILLTSAPAGRRLSVLPPVHIVLAREEQIVPSLEDAYAFLKEKSLDWSYAVLISGPSRTSDIEKQLVLGAHGPKRLLVIIIRS